MRYEEEAKPRNYRDELATAAPSNFTDERLESDVVERVSRCQEEDGAQKEAERGRGRNIRAA